MRKARINAYISHGVDKLLSEAASRPGVSKAAIVDAALAAFLAPEDTEHRDMVILKRLDRIDARLGRIEQDLIITSETLALYVRYFMNVTPPLPERDRVAAQAKGREKFEQFLAQLAKRIGAGRRIMEDLVRKDTAFPHEL